MRDESSEKLGHLPKVTQPLRGKARTQPRLSARTQTPHLSVPCSRPGSARINSLLLFILGVACTTPLLRSARSGAAPREVFRGRTLLSVEPGNKVRCRHERVEWGWGSGVATWLGGSLPRRELGALALHPWPLRGTEQPPHPLSPSRKRRSLASPSAPCPACCTCSPGCLRSAPT